MSHPGTTLKGRNVSRAVIRWIINNFPETSSRGWFDCGVVPILVLPEYLGTNPTCTLQVQYQNNGNREKPRVSFHVQFQVDGICWYNDIEYSLTIRSPTGDKLHDIRQLCRREPNSSNDTVNYICSTWLFEGNLHVWADVSFKHQPVQLKPEATQNALLDGLRRVSTNPEHHDLVLIGADGRQCKTQKIHLALASPVFNEILKKQHQENIYKIDEANADGIQAILECIYGADINGFDNHNVVRQVLTLAEKYQIEALKTRAVLKLATLIRAENVFELLLFAERRSDKFLKNAAFLYVEDNLESIIIHDKIRVLMNMKGAANQSLYEEWLDHLHLRRMGTPRQR